MSLAAALRYLDAALGDWVPSQARLFALLCLLCARVDGVAELPPGLLRSWRLADRGRGLTQTLATHGWLEPLQSADDQLPWCACEIRVVDPAARVALATWPRRERRALLDQAARLLAQASSLGSDHEAQLAQLRHHGRRPDIQAGNDAGRGA